MNSKLKIGYFWTSDYIYSPTYVDKLPKTLPSPGSEQEYNNDYENNENDKEKGIKADNEKN